MSSVQRVDAVKLSKTYGRRHALRAADFTLVAGQVTAIIGQNGAGKSTTFNLLSRRISPTSGDVHFDGRPAGDGPERRRVCGYLSHASYLYGALSARENLSIVAGLYRVSEAPMKDILARIGLEKHADRPVRTFSRGMTQRLALGRLLLADPDVWLLDEPASGLDEGGRRWLEGEIRALARAGKVVALSSHSRQMVSELSSHVVVLAQGRVVYAGPVDGAATVERLFTEHIG